MDRLEDRFRPHGIGILPDARLLQALVLRDGRGGKWLPSQGIDTILVEWAFPDTGWS